MIDTSEYYGGKYPSPPDPIEVGTKEVKVYCTVVTYLDVPADLENYSDMKEWIETNYNLYNNLSKKYIFDDVQAVYVDEIEK
jgi:hypothetical protein